MSSSGRHILAAYACIMRRTRHCQRSRGTYPFAGEDNAAPPHSSSLDISSNAPFTCSTQNLFCLLNFVDLFCEECSGEGFCWAGGSPQARSRDKAGRLAS